jgi:hypothetical protein
MVPARDGRAYVIRADASGSTEDQQPQRLGTRDQFARFTFE